MAFQSSMMAGEPTVPPDASEPPRTEAPAVVATQTKLDAPPAVATNRRAHPRNVVAQLSWLDNVRVKYGPAVTLLDLSPGGAQIEATGYPLQPGSAIVLEIRSGGQTTTVPAQVVRCSLASLSPVPTYRGALRFKRPLSFPEDSSALLGGNTEWDPAQEFERLNKTLHRQADVMDESTSGEGASGTLSAAGARALDEAFLMIERNTSPGAPSFRREMARLFEVAARSVEARVDVNGLVSNLIERLRRSIPTLTIRLEEQSGSLRPDDTVCFQVPTDRRQVPTRLVVEFPKDCALEEWHLHLLQGAAQLVGAMRTWTPVN